MGNWGDFCTNCGAEQSGTFPRKCLNGHYTYASPVTVGIALQPVQLNDRVGILVVQRNINPYKGEYALPGGFVDAGELSRPAAIRELFEETTLRHPVDQAVYFSEATGGSHREDDPRVHNMYFYGMPLLEQETINLDFQNSETQGLDVVFLSKDGKQLEHKNGVAVQLCFDTHHQAALQFLQTQEK